MFRLSSGALCHVARSPDFLSASERERLLAIPEELGKLICHYTFSEADLLVIRQRHGDANRLGFAVQRCLLWCLGQGGLTTTDVPPALLQWTPRNGASIRRAGPSV